MQVGTQGASGNHLIVNRRFRINDANGNNTGYGDFVYESCAEMVYTAQSSANSLVQTFHRFWTCMAGSATPVIKLEIGTDITITSRLNFNPPSYTFPFSSNTSLGYYLQTIGTGISTPTFASNTPTTLVTISSVTIGVWKVDFSIKNTVGAAGAITTAQSFISITSANTNTPATGFTGSLVRSHVTENYGIGDIQIIISSMTLNLSAATNIYLTALRTYSTGGYTFVGEIGLTRVA